MIHDLLRRKHLTDVVADQVFGSVRVKRNPELLAWGEAYFSL
jgi:hypothetical protein